MNNNKEWKSLIDSKLPERYISQIVKWIKRSVSLCSHDHTEDSLNRWVLVVLAAINSLVNAVRTSNCVQYAKIYVCGYAIPLSSQFAVVWCIINPLLAQITNTFFLITIWTEQSNNETDQSKKKQASQRMDDKLQMSYECHDFHGQVLKCHCIPILLNEELVTIKAYFKDLVDTFWMDEYHVTNRTNCDEIGTWFGHFLLPSCTLNSQRPNF